VKGHARPAAVGVRSAAVFGKLLGAGIGGCVSMLLEWPPLVVFALVVVGGLLGHVVFDREDEEPRTLQPKSTAELLEEGARRRARARPAPKLSPRRAPLPEHAALAAALTPLFTEVARADGDVVSDEVRRVREFFERQGFDEAGLELVRTGLKAALADPPQDIEALVKTHRSAVKPALRVEVLRAMYEVVLSDGPMGRAEQDTLRRVVEHFNLSDEQLRDVTRDFFGSGEAHYETLGLTEAASDDEIRSAFRRLAAENHPDRVASLGAQEADAAAARFRAVKEAYEALRQLRGL
jgi:DnaJ like chaperone protein